MQSSLLLTNIPGPTAVVATQATYSDKESAIPDVEISAIHEPVANPIESNNVESAAASHVSPSENDGQQQPQEQLQQLENIIENPPTNDDLTVTNANPQDKEEEASLAPTNNDDTLQITDTVIDSVPTAENEEQAISIPANDIITDTTSSILVEPAVDANTEGDDLTIDAAPTEELDEQTFSIDEVQADNANANE